MDAFDLTGRVAVVTGGNGGIGFGMARGLARAGASIAVVGRDAAKSAGAVSAIEEIGVRAVAIEADVTESAALQRDGGDRGGTPRRHRHPRQQTPASTFASAPRT